MNQPGDTITVNSKFLEDEQEMGITQIGKSRQESFQSISVVSFKKGVEVMFKCLFEYRPPVIIRDLNKICVLIPILLSEI